MKRSLAFVLSVFIGLFTMPVLTYAVQFDAVATTNFQLRKQPREEAGRLMLVEKGSKVQVEKVDGAWGKITVKKLSGYAKMTWLCRFRAHNPLKDQVPGLPHQVGVVRVDQALQVAVPGYKGNLLIPGDVLAVNYFDQEEAKAYMMREVVTLPADYVTFTPFVPWKEAQPGDLLYGFTTFYNEHTGGKLAQNRAHNINVAGKKLDGITVQPGEALSFNGVCSPYRGSNGYLIAPIVGGDGKGYGGGVCQLSTTLYNAALGLPLRIDEWEIHSQQGVDYAPLYFDATVGAYSDLAFTNLLPYAVRLQVLPQNGVLTVLIYRDGASSN
ncbi:MAG: VanW family protein [Christensenellales bacterium]